MVGLLLQRVDVHDVFVQQLGVLKVGKLPYHIFRFLTGTNHNLGQLEGIRTDALDIVAVEPEKNVLDLVRDLVDVLAEKNDVLSFDWGNKGFGQHMEQLVLFAVGSVFHCMDLFQFVPNLAWIELLHDLMQELGRLTGVIRARQKGIKIK